MEVKFKKLNPKATTPTYAKPGDAGLDLTALTVEQGDFYIEYGTGLAIEIPEGFVGLIFPRSSISKTTQSLSNHVGVIDSGYRGEIKFRFRNHPVESGYGLGLYQSKIYQPGEKVGQLIIMPYPKITLIETTELATTSRGEGGFGSTGA